MPGTWYLFLPGTGTFCCGTLQQYRHAMRPTAVIRYGAEAVYTPVYVPLPFFKARLNCSFVYSSTINTFIVEEWEVWESHYYSCLLYTSPSPRDLSTSRMPSSA